MGITSASGCGLLFLRTDRRDSFRELYTTNSDREIHETVEIKKSMAAFRESCKMTAKTSRNGLQPLN